MTKLDFLYINKLKRWKKGNYSTLQDAQAIKGKHVSKLYIFIHFKRI